MGGRIRLAVAKAATTRRASSESARAEAAGDAKATFRPFSCKKSFGHREVAIYAIDVLTAYKLLINQLFIYLYQWQ